MRLLISLMVVFCIFGVVLKGAFSADEAQSETHREAKEAYAKGLEFKAQGERAKAYEHFCRVVELAPDQPAGHFQAGLMALFMEQFDKAAVHFEKCKELVPEELQVREKLVATYQGLGKPELRDAERKALFELLARTQDETYTKRGYYLRDSFAHNTDRVAVIEYFDPAPPYRIMYKAFVKPEAGQEWAITMESPDFTTTVLRQSGDIGPEERAYSIDAYHDKNTVHETYALFNKTPPTYDEFRTWIILILDGKVEPQTRSRTEKKASR